MSLKKDGKVTVTIEVEFNKSDFKSFDIQEDEWDSVEEGLSSRLNSLPDVFFWDSFEDFVDEELEDIRSESPQFIRNQSD